MRKLFMGLFALVWIVAFAFWVGYIYRCFSSGFTDTVALDFAWTATFTMWGAMLGLTVSRI